jgi:AcrR family transcriptional regulator
MSADDRREQILDITHAIVDAESFHAATLNRVATAAGVTRTVIYQQFGGLKGLFIALIDREAARARAQFVEAVGASQALGVGSAADLGAEAAAGTAEGYGVQPAADLGADPVAGSAEELGAFGHAFLGVLRAADANPATWRLFLFPPQGAPPELHERLAQSQILVREFFASALVRIEPDLPDPEYTARILNAAGEELLRLRLSDPQSATRERLLSHVRRLTPGLLRAAGHV